MGSTISKVAYYLGVARQKNSWMNREIRDPMKESNNHFAYQSNEISSSY